MTRSGRGIYRLLLLVLLVQVSFVNGAFAGEAASPGEWEKIVKAAEQEGEVVYSASGSHRFLEEFHKSYPKIKTTSVTASCNDVVSRIRWCFQNGAALPKALATHKPLRDLDP